MSSTASGHPIRKTLKRRLRNGDPYDNYGGFAGDDSNPIYKVLFHDDESYMYFLDFLEGQFFSQIDGQHADVTAYLGDQEQFSMVNNITKGHHFSFL